MFKCLGPAFCVRVKRPGHPVMVMSALVLVVLLIMIFVFFVLNSHPVCSGSLIESVVEI
ncbi:hypothetical protein DPMN_169507 [Dreissena polymorpha]|uniref:Uncharacterized protein n=1 Tax=Dreissena polymorpha TaxID=45954 RepID=A0A9D4DWW1_DREPO|nr:hypothetical protein DPMN_169507 [Dreissena polymorpha]